MSERKRRLQKLADAATVLEELRPMFQGQMIAQALRQLRSISSAYQEQCDRLDELAKAERKPPQRVQMRARRKQPIRVAAPKRDSFESVGDYDMEQAKELADRLGDDIPDGSD